MDRPQPTLPTYNNIEGSGRFTVRAYRRLSIEERDGTYLVHFIDEDRWGVYDGSPEKGWIGGFNGGRQPFTEEEARSFFEDQVKASHRLLEGK